MATEVIEIGRMPNGQTVGEYWTTMEAEMKGLDAAFDNLERQLRKLEQFPSFARWLFGRSEDSLLGCLRRM